MSDCAECGADANNYCKYCEVAYCDVCEDEHEHTTGGYPDSHEPDQGDTRMTTDERLDSYGHPPPFPPGTRVLFIPDKTHGTVESQTLHYDGCEMFWGNLFLNMDDGTRIHCNCWQTTRVEV